MGGAILLLLFGEGEPGATESYYVAAAMAYVPGAVSAQAFVPGAVAADDYVPGAVAAQGKA